MNRERLIILLKSSISDALHLKGSTTLGPDDIQAVGCELEDQLREALSIVAPETYPYTPTNDGADQ